jgi:hypothetical protein
MAAVVMMETFPMVTLEGVFAALEMALSYKAVSASHSRSMTGYSRTAAAS